MVSSTRNQLWVRYFAAWKKVYSFTAPNPSEEVRRAYEDHLLRRNMKCPYCDGVLKEVLKDHYPGWGDDNDTRDSIIDACDGCGWWREAVIFGKYHSPYNRLPFVDAYNNPHTRTILVPLLDEIRRYPSILYSMNPKELELATASVLRGIFDCDVQHVGKSGDGGIDIVVLRSYDDPIVVQVKRRADHNAVEGVCVIRELRGAMVLANSSDGIFVTTADHYSPAAVEASGRIESTSTIQRIRLIDCQAFMDLLRVVLPIDLDVPPWFISNFLRNSAISNPPYRTFEELPIEEIRNEYRANRPKA